MQSIVFCWKIRDRRSSLLGSIKHRFVENTSVNFSLALELVRCVKVRQGYDSIRIRFAEAFLERRC